MSTTVTATDLTKIYFEKSAPSGFTHIGTLSSSIKVYKNSSVSTEIAFVFSGTIYAPSNCYNLFSNLTKLENFFFNNFDTSNVTVMGYYSTSNSNSNEGMFKACSSLKSLDLSGWDVSNVTIMADTFFACSSLKNLDLSGWDTSKVTSTEYMFYCCTGLHELDISSFSLAKISSSTRVQNMFGGHYQQGGSVLNLYKLILPSTLPSFFSINFYNIVDLCRTDTGALVGKHSTLYAGDFEGAVFNAELKSAYAGKTLEAIPYLPATAENVLNVYSWKNDIYSYDYMEYPTNPSSITKIQFEKTAPNGYVQIGTLRTGIKVYRNSSVLTEIAFVHPRTILAPSSSQILFSNLTSLTSITFNNFDTSEATAMDKTFMSCSSLTSLDLTGWDVSNVTTFCGSVEDKQYGMFSCCTSLEYLNISSFDTSSNKRSFYEHTLGYMFIYRYNFTAGYTFSPLKKIVLPNTTMSYYFNIASQYALYRIDTGDEVVKADTLTKAYSYTGLTLVAKQTLTANSNGGSISSTTGWTGTGTSATKTVYYKTAIGTLPSASRSGYKLMGWTLTQDGTDYVSTSSELTADTTIYAKWAQLYTVTIAVNNSSYGAVSKTTVSNVPSGTKITTSGNTINVNGTTITATPTELDGYTTTFSSFTNGTATVTSNITVTANFTRTAKQFTITYSSNGGTGSDVTQTVSYNSTFTTNSGATFAKTGYSLSGWSTNATTSAGNYKKLNSSYTFTETSNLTLYALWEITTYSITFNLNGGTWQADYTPTATFTIEQSVTLPTSENITRANYRFDGWFENSSFTGNAVTSISVGTTGNKVYYAKWTELKNGKITININFAEDLINTTSYGVVKIEFTINGERQLYTLALKEKTYTIENVYHATYTISVINTKKINTIADQTITISSSQLTQTVTINVTKDPNGNKYVVTST